MAKVGLVLSKFLMALTTLGMFKLLLMLRVLDDRSRGCIEVVGLAEAEDSMREVWLVTWLMVVDDGVKLFFLQMLRLAFLRCAFGAYCWMSDRFSFGIVLLDDAALFARSEHSAFLTSVCIVITYLGRISMPLATDAEGLVGPLL